MLSPEPRETPSAPAHRRSPAPELPDPVFCWRGARAPARLSLGPRDRARVCRAPLLPVFRSRFPQRQEGPGSGRGGERAGTRGPVGGRVRGAGAVSPRGAEPGRSEALSPAKGPLCRPRDPRVLRISLPAGDRKRLRGTETAPLSPRRLPASRGAPGSRVPAAARGPELLRGRDPRSRPARALRARRLPRGRCFPERPAERQSQPGRCGRWRRRRTRTRGRLGFRLRRPPQLQPQGRWTPSEVGFAVCPRSAGAAPKLRLGVNCTRAASLIHVSGVKEPRVPTLGGRKVLYKGFVEGVLSPAKIRRKADVKAERSSKLPDDVEGGVDCGADAGGRGGRSRAGKRPSSSRAVCPGAAPGSAQGASGTPRDPGAGGDAGEWERAPWALLRRLAPPRDSRRGGCNKADLNCVDCKTATMKSSGSRTRRGPLNELYEQDSRGLAKPRSLERGYRGRETNALKGDPRVWTPSHQRSGGEDPLSPRSEAPRMAGRGEMLVDPSEHPNPPHPQRLGACQHPADPIFSRSRPAQASAAPGISPPGLPASGAPFRVCRLNRSPCEGRRRKGTLCKRPPGAHDNRFERPRDEAPSPAGRSGAYRPNARARRGPLPRRGLPARDSTARSGPGRAESGRPRRRGPPREIARPRRTRAREILQGAGLCAL
ncbi:hypothetical protein R6Z07_003641 [Ovis aries]